MSAKILEMISQMIMVGFKEAELQEDTPIGKILSESPLGGVILYDIHLPDYCEAQRKNPALSRSEGACLFPRNVRSQEQVRALSHQLRQRAKAPLFIAVDMEGGRVCRLGPQAGFPHFPSPQELGMKNDPKETYRVACSISITLKECGINVNLAPVVDLTIHPQGLICKGGRSFGKDPSAVYRHARAFILAHRQQGILTALKHFPGTGSAPEDPHLQMPDITAFFRDEELKPFAWLIQDGLADLIMTSHLHHRGWDGEFPVTLSAKILTGLLRQKLGYSGVIISDDLLMGAIIRKYSLEEAAVLAVNAGVDLLLVSNNSPEGYDPDLFYRLRTILKGAVDRGQIPMGRLEEAHGRIAALKNFIRPNEGTRSKATGGER